MSHDRRPQAKAMEASLAELGSKYDVLNVRARDGLFESLTIKSPYDFSAMDIAYVEGDDVTTQVGEMLEEFRTMTLIGDDQQKLRQLSTFNARFDIFHFEQVVDSSADDFLDPGGLFLVIQKLVELCGGVGHDPQSKTLI